MPTRPSRKSRNKNKNGDDISDDMLRLAASRWTKAIAQARDAAARGVDLAEVARPPPPPPPPPAPVAAAPAAPAAPVALGAATGRRRAAVVENGTHYYARDHAEDLVQFLCDAATPSDPARRRVVFAFYTSMREANAQPIARYLTKGKRADMYERKFNKDDASGENSWDTMRDLPKVWGTPAKAAHGFDETNTLATVRKGGDDALEYLAAYIDGLLDHPDDIRTAVDDRPFVAPSF
ncbi:hypothetical protein JL722_9820 [Aureococcus anophagefferens]|nr:hypothetical protein JL722_9820 [Aureococcus anophagefferens]